MNSRYFIPKIISVGVICLYFWNYALNPARWNFIDSANLIFHEAGHSIFFFFGDFIQAAMGSGLQILLPLFISAYFFFTGQKISASLCLLWVGQNFISVSLYAGDAVRMQMDLLGGEAVTHDWNYLLSTAGLLKYTSLIAGLLHFAGIICLMLGTAAAIYFCTRKSGETS